MKYEIKMITNLLDKIALHASSLKGSSFNFKQDEKYIALSLPSELPNENDVVVILETNGHVENIPV